MTNNDIYKDIAMRTDGAVMIGVVGPVRTGKSTFIKRFMETLVIPNIDDEYARERARDELPQSGSGRTIMTAEPKFVPEDGVKVSIDGECECTVRLVDCVGYMVPGAAGILEDGSERLVTTPWFDHEVSMTEAAESGTRKVICEHSTIGIVVTTDGSICDIERSAYEVPEGRVIEELKTLGKPFVILINSAAPDSTSALELNSALSEKYTVPCINVNCLALTENDISDIMKTVLGQFPISEIAIGLPEWMDYIGCNSGMKYEILKHMAELTRTVSNVSDIEKMLGNVSELELIEAAQTERADLGSGIVNVQIKIPRKFYYKLISDESGISIENDGALVCVLQELGKIKNEYLKVQSALKSVEECGYGVVLPQNEDIQIDEPQLVKQSGKYSVKLKARANAIHMLKTGVETIVSPSFAGDKASDEIISFLLQGLDGDMSRLWESNIFGQPLYDIAKKALEERIEGLPVNARSKLQETLQRIVNEGRGTLICILL